MREALKPPQPLVPGRERGPDPDCTAELRDCRRHGLVVFHRYGGRKDRYRWRCKRCVGEAVTRRHQKVKRILVDDAGGGEIEAGLLPSPPLGSRWRG